MWITERPKDETWEAIERHGLPWFLTSLATRIQRFIARFIALRFASSTHLCYYESRMSALIFTGSLWAVLPGRAAIAGNQCRQCAVCESCKVLICKVLR